MHRYIVGLTGGIASGKSTVADIFASHGIEIIDADVIARELVARGTASLGKITEYFGADILTDSGELDRNRLKNIIFNDSEAKLWLEGLLHPLIRQEIDKKIRSARSDYVILVVPLLLESGQYEFVNRVLVVDAPEELQITRTMQRDGISRDAARKIIGAQMPGTKRLALADDIIQNHQSLAKLKQEVSKLHEFYRQQSSFSHQAD
ncbi:MAG: dephospho-CoA kinase [Pseudohongiellaceae bacterium]